VSIIERPDDEQPLIRYLLGLSTPEERRMIEERYLNDPALLEHLEAIESEVIEDYLADSLSPQERSSFEHQYLGNPEGRRKVELTAALRRRFQGGPSVNILYAALRSGWAAALLVIITASFFYLAMRPVTFFLHPGGPLRSLEGREQTISIPQRDTAVRLRLDLTGLGVTALDHAVLRTVEDENPVWSQRVHSQTGQSFLELIIQSAALEDRDYILTLEAGSNVVASYAFRAHKN
jgi:hypothetical protein